MTHRARTWHAPPECRPAHAMPALSPAAICDETYGLIRERERDLAAMFHEYAWLQMSARVVERAEEAHDHAAALEALAHSEALAAEGTAMRALDRTWGALVAFEARAKTNPAAAARALCRWIERVRESGKVEK